MKKILIGLLIGLMLISTYKIDVINLQESEHIEVKKELNHYNYMIDIYKGSNTDAHFTIFIVPDLKIVK